MGVPLESTALEGTVERITFYNPENGFSVVRLRVRGRREPVAVVGTLPAVQPGEWLALVGQWRTDPRHGAQFRPDTASVQPPSEVEDLVRYLGSGLIRQLGPVLARRIVDTFGERTLEVLDARPERVREVPGIGTVRARALAAAWAEHRALRAVTAFLSQHRIDTRFAPRLVAAYGQDAPKVLSANPYRLVAEVPGLGFAAADRLGRDLEVRPAAPGRLQAAVHAALLRAAEQGHTRLDRATLVESAAALVGVEPALVEAAITQLAAGGVIGTGSAGYRPHPDPLPGGEGATLPSGGEGWGEGRLPGAPSPTPTASGRLRIYEPTPPAASAPEAGLGFGLRGLVEAEEALAARLRALAGRPSRLAAAAVDAWLAGDEGARALSDEQRAAVRAAAVSSCFVLTGGPGVGKTTTVRVLVRCLQGLGRSVALAAPTGKAAKRLGEVVGLEARTIHRLLGAGPQGFRHGPREPLPYDALIVDEASMLDTQLARAVVSALGRQSQLVLVGDADQLPSVGPGQVLRDLLLSGLVPSARLETVFRQAARSQIVSNAHRIRQGQVPEFPSGPLPLAPSPAREGGMDAGTRGTELIPPLVGSPFPGREGGRGDRSGPEAALARGVDCVFVPAPASRIAEVAAEWAAARLPRLVGLEPHEVQTLAPLTRVCQSLNSLLQARLNPPRGQAERPHGALALRLGDRVIQTRNNYTLGVFNGDTGVIVGLEPDEVAVDFGDGRVVAYTPADLLDLDHAYCLTVHRAQGSEWPGVIILASTSFGPMLSRNLLYTALTRARRAAVIIGDEPALARAVAETRDQHRSTGLAALLVESRQLTVDSRQPGVEGPTREGATSGTGLATPGSGLSTVDCQLSTADADDGPR